MDVVAASRALSHTLDSLTGLRTAHRYGKLINPTPVVTSFRLSLPCASTWARFDDRLAQPNVSLDFRGTGVLALKSMVFFCQEYDRKVGCLCTPPLGFCPHDRSIRQPPPAEIWLEQGVSKSNISPFIEGVES